MNWFSNLFEKRANPNAPHSNYEYISAGGSYFNIGTINEEKAMSIPAVAAAINLYAGVVSSLPLEIHTYDPATESYVLDEKNPLWDIVSEHVNDDWSSSTWLDFMMRRAMINGRSLSYIETDQRGYITNIFPLDNTKTQIKINSDGSKQYIYRYGTKGQKSFASHEVIDLVWQLKSDTYSHVDPLKQHEKFFQNAILAEEFANSIFQSGPMPPLVAYKKLNEATPAKSTENASRALKEAIKVARSTDGIVMLPDNITLGDMPYDPSKSQVLETRKFIIGEAARIYHAPPALLHDLTTGSFNNTEQQAQNFLKFYLTPWLSKIEKELNLKLLGRNSAKTSFIKFSTETLTMPGFKDFIASYSTATDKGIITRDEVRYKLNLPKKGGAADELSMQKQFSPINTDTNNGDDNSQ